LGNNKRFFPFNILLPKGLFHFIENILFPLKIKPFLPVGKKGPPGLILGLHKLLLFLLKEIRVGFPHLGEKPIKVFTFKKF